MGEGPVSGGGRKRSGPLFGRAPRKEVDEELAFHLEERVRDYMRQGMDEESARAAALARFGDVERVGSDCARVLGEERRQHARRAWVADLCQDIRYGVRSALRAPLFSLLAVLTLALGIGANSAIFGVVKSVLVDALPYEHPDRLARVYAYWADGSFDRFTMSAGTVRDIQERQTSFEVLGATAGSPSESFFSVGPGAADMVQTLWLEPAHLAALGVEPLLGRGFVAEDARDTAQVVLLSHAMWQQRFGGAADVLGRTVWVNELPRTVIGVMPQRFVPPLGGADVYMPLSLDPMLRDEVRARGTHWLWLHGRLRPGVTLAAAQSELASIGLDLARAHPRDNESIRISAEPLRDAMVGHARTPLLVLMASAGLVLLIACANLAGALLSRTISRRTEFAVRASIGAGRGRIVRQLLTESALLAVVGGAAGLGLALSGVGVLREVAGPVLPQHADLSIDGGAMALTFMLALVTGILFGVAPAFAAARSSPQGTLRSESRSLTERARSRRMRGALVAAQVALCLSLLAGAGLLARSLWAMASAPHGYDPDNVLTVRLPLPATRYVTSDERLDFFVGLSERLGGLPGVRAVAATSDLPGRVGNRDGFSIDGASWPAGFQTPFVLAKAVSDEYFETLRIPFRAGRTFNSGDHADAPRVAIISEAMARRYWPQGDALGSRIRTGPDPQSPLLEIVGIVGDVRNDLALTQPEPQVYYANRQYTWASALMIRTERDPLALVEAVRREVGAFDAAVPMHDVVTLRAVIGQKLEDHRLPALLMTAFGALALLLAAVGVYAMFANLAAAREREFGVRMALGSSRIDIARLVLLQGAHWMALGLTAGAFGVIAVSRALRSLLFGVEPLDLVALGSAVIALLICAFVALLVPVRRATRVDPATVMR
jgi:putative ABC transport system permease protein